VVPRPVARWPRRDPDRRGGGHPGDPLVGCVPRPGDVRLRDHDGTGGLRIRAYVRRARLPPGAPALLRPERTRLVLRRDRARRGPPDRRPGAWPPGRRAARLEPGGRAPRRATATGHPEGGVGQLNGLDIAHLTVRFGGHLAVDDLTMAALLGRLTGLIGPNG